MSAIESGIMKEAITSDWLGADLASAKSYLLFNDFAPSSLSGFPVLSGALVVGAWLVPAALIAPAVAAPLIEASYLSFAGAGSAIYSGLAFDSSYSSRSALNLLRF